MKFNTDILKLLNEDGIELLCGCGDPNHWQEADPNEIGGQDIQIRTGGVEPLSYNYLGDGSYWMPVSYNNMYDVVEFLITQLVCSPNYQKYLDYLHTKIAQTK